MSTTEDTSAIDEKKAEDSGTSTTSPDFKGFISNYLLSIVFTICLSIFIIGGLGLYTTKVAQANILPDDIDFAPYTMFDRIVKDNPPFYVDMNVMRPSFFSENTETLSQKAKFNSQEYLDSFDGGFICSLKESAKADGGLFASVSLYFSVVYERVIASNFNIINKIFFSLSYLPESIIMFLYGTFGIFIWLALCVYSYFWSSIYHITNFTQLFREASNDNNLLWESDKNISLLRFNKLVITCCMFIPILLSAVIMPVILTLYGLISPLYATYNIKNGKDSNNVFNFIYNNFVYKKFFFFILATISLFKNGNTYLGSNSIIGIIIAVIFAYFMGLYKNEMPEPGTDGFSFGIKQNMKQASLAKFDKNKPDIVMGCTINVDDKEMNRIIENPKRNIRMLTKQTETGSEVEGDHSIPFGNVEQYEQPIIQGDDVQSAIPFEQGYDVTPSAPPLNKIGGRKQKSLKSNKKYNIRWT